VDQGQVGFRKKQASVRVYLMRKRRWVAGTAPARAAVKKVERPRINGQSFASALPGHLWRLERRRVLAGNGPFVWDVRGQGTAAPMFGPGEFDVGGG